VGVLYLVMCVRSVLMLPVKKDNTGVLTEASSLSNIQDSKIIRHGDEGTYRQTVHQ
jgi:hypothetical protein